MLQPVILCVDDEKIILDSLREQLFNKLGDDFYCEIAEGGAEALEIIQELLDDKRQIAVVISDQLMPGMNGDEFLIKAHQLIPDTHKILLTGQASIDAVQNAIKYARLYRYVVKPWEETDLMLTVEEAAQSFMQQVELMEYNTLLQRLNAASRDLSSRIDQTNLIIKTLDSAMTNIGAEMGYLLLRTKEGFRVGAVADRKTPAHTTTPEENETLSSKLLAQLPNALNTPLKYRVVASIDREGRQLGYLWLENPKTQEHFSTGEKEVIQMLAHQAAIAITNAELYQSIQAKTELLKAEKEKGEAYHAVIESNNKALTDNILYARRIQEAIMPERAELATYFQDSFIFYRAKDIVSGDFFWWAVRGDRLLLAVVDCTGHGVPGALMSLIGSNFLNLIINEQHITNPAQVLQRLNERVRTALKQDRQSTTKDGMDLCLLNLPLTGQGTAIYAGARRPLILMRGSQQISFEATRASIGEYLPDGTEPHFINHRVELKTQDRIFMFTDGIADQFGGPNNKKFTYKRLHETLLGLDNRPMQDHFNLLSQTIDAWKGTHYQTDDMLLIGLRIG